MSVVRVTGGTLNVEDAGGVFPGHDLPGTPVFPGHDLPSGGHPWVPGHLPDPPPNIWPPLTPSHPIQPAPPGTPPGVIWPPIHGPVDPGYGRPVGPGHVGGGPMPGVPARPDQGLPTPPAGAPPHPDQGLPGGTHPDQGLPSKTYWVVVGIPGVGWRYTTVDPSLSIGYPLPPAATPKA